MATRTVQVKPAAPSVVTPRQIEEAREKAQRLALAAYGAQPVRQADGSALLLCWNGRLHRAFGLANEALACGDATRKAMLEQAIAKLSQELHAAEAAATAAEADYHALCALAEVEPQQVAPPECTCAGCVDQRRLHWIGAAQATVRAAVWALLGGPVGGRPTLVDLMERAADPKVQQQVWRLLKAVSDGFLAYEQACRECGEQPDWREVWR